VGLAATEDIVGGGGPVDMVDIMDIMVGRADIMAEAIFTEVPASTSVGTLGTPTTIPTGIILLSIIILPLITILINQMLLLSLPPRPNRSKTPVGTTARLPRVLPLRQKLFGWVDEGGSDSSPVGKRKEVT